MCLDVVAHMYLNVLQGVSYFLSVVWKRVYQQPAQWKHCYAGWDAATGDYKEIYGSSSSFIVDYDLCVQRGGICHVMGKQMRTSPFVTVQYRHPRMAKGVYLDVDRSYYRAGNDLFSATFVKRTLLYQEGASVPFDDDYVLEMFDVDKMELITLRSDQYIHLLDRGYIIIAKQA